MTKFEKYLEAVKEMKTEKYEAPSEAYKDLISAIRDSLDVMDSSLFDPNELMDALDDNYNFTLNQDKTIATHSSEAEFDVGKIIEICNNAEDLYNIEASHLKPALKTEEIT